MSSSKMSPRYLILPIISLLVIPIILYYGIFIPKPIQREILDVLVGVDAAYDNLEEIKRFVDEVSSCTNTFVIGTTGITYDEIKLNETIKYVYDKDINFIVYMPLQDEIGELDEQRQWVEDARTN